MEAVAITDEQVELADKIRRFQSGETQLFAWFAEIYFLPAARSLSHDDDIIQLTQVKCWQMLERFFVKPNSLKCFRTISFRWCRWACCQEWRKKRVKHEDLDDHPEIKSNHIPREISDEEIYTLIRNSELSELERWCIEQIPHMTRRQTAQALGIPLERVNHAIKRGRKKIRDRMKAQEEA